MATYTPGWKDEATRQRTDEYDDVVYDNMETPEVNLHAIRVLLRSRYLENKGETTIDEIGREIRKDIESDEDLVNLLKTNKMIQYNYPYISFNPCINAKSESSIKDDLQRMEDGVSLGDILISNPEAEVFIDELISDGSIIATNESNSDKKVFAIFPRDTIYRAPLPGKARVTQSSRIVECDENMKEDLRPGDCIEIGGKTYRVDYDPLGYTPFSASSIKDNDKMTGKGRRGWAHEVSTTIVLAEPYTGKTLQDVTLYKYGLSNDLRALWLKNCEKNVYDNEVILNERIKKENINYTTLYDTKKVSVKRVRKMN